MDSLHATVINLQHSAIDTSVGSSPVTDHQSVATAAENSLQGICSEEVSPACAGPTSGRPSARSGAPHAAQCRLRAALLRPWLPSHSSPRGPARRIELSSMPWNAALLVELWPNGCDAHVARRDKLSRTTLCVLLMPHRALKCSAAASQARHACRHLAWPEPSGSSSPHPHPIVDLQQP